MRRFLVLALLVWLDGVQAEAVTAAVDSGAMRPQDRLANLGAAMRQLDYKGVFTYEQNGKTASVQWVHAVREGVEHERLLGLDGAHRELLRERPAGCMQSSERNANDRLIESLSGNLSALESHYSFAFEAPATIAGRPADVVRVAARDEYRFGYRLAVDHDTGLLLGVELIDGRGEVVERFRFITVQIGNVVASDLLPMTTAPTHLDTGNCKQTPVLQPVIAPWRFDLPPGYSLCSYERHGDDGDAMVFSDGLGSFSVFVHARDNDHDDVTAHEMRGSTMLDSQAVDLEGRKYVVTVVGEVPAATVKRVQGSLARNGSAAADK